MFVDVLCYVWCRNSHRLTMMNWSVAGTTKYIGVLLEIRSGACSMPRSRLLHHTSETAAAVAAVRSLRMSNWPPSWLLKRRCLVLILYANTYPWHTHCFSAVHCDWRLPAQCLFVFYLLFLYLWRIVVIRTPVSQPFMCKSRVTQSINILHAAMMLMST